MPSYERTQAMKCERCGEVNPAEIHTCSPQEPVAWGVPNTRPTEKAQFMMLLHSLDGCQYPEQLVPLYTAPPPHSATHSADSAESFCKPEKNEHEPVAFVCFKRGEVDYESDVVISNTAGDCMDDSTEWRPVYTATPQREWQGLTDEDVWELVQKTPDFSETVAAIEAKLKEKNS